MVVFVFRRRSLARLLANLAAWNNTALNMGRQSDRDDKDEAIAEWSVYLTTQTN